MDAAIFWEIIGRYNSQTLYIQIFVMALLVSSFFLSYTGKCKWLLKLVLGIVNLYIGIVFMGYYGTEKIQTYFALPLFVLCSFLFIFESIKNKNDIFEKLNKLQVCLLIIYILYPAVSFMLGNRFPKITTWIMPCPVMSLSIILYSGYKNKNRLLLAVMTLWGLTGVKAFIANAYEDLILLVCGIYCIYVFIKQKPSPKGAA
jgi:hypothetical protein